METVAQAIASAETEERASRADAETARRRPGDDVNLSGVSVAVLCRERIGIDSDLSDLFWRRHDRERHAVDVDGSAGDATSAEQPRVTDHVFGSTKQLQQPVAVDRRRSDWLSDRGLGRADDADHLFDGSQAEAQ